MAANEARFDAAALLAPAGYEWAWAHLWRIGSYVTVCGVDHSQVSTFTQPTCPACLSVAPQVRGLADGEAITVGSAPSIDSKARELAEAVRKSHDAYAHRVAWESCTFTTCVLAREILSGPAA